MDRTVDKAGRIFVSVTMNNDSITIKQIFILIELFRALHMIDVLLRVVLEGI